MNKKQKILIFLLLILLLLVLALIFTSESFKPKNSPVQEVKQASSVLLEADYRLKTKELFNIYDSLIKNDSFNKENIAELKNKLLALKGIPEKFKDLHIRFILALTGLENYLDQKSELKENNDGEPGKNSSLEAINQLKLDYSWLNN